MKRFSIIFLCITLVLLLLWQLPWCYTFLQLNLHARLFHVQLRYR